MVERATKVAWKAALDKFALGADPTWESIAKALKEDFAKYVPKKGATTKPVQVLSDAELAAGTKKVHATFKKHAATTNELGIDGLVMAYKIDHDVESLADADTLVRSIVKHAKSVKTFIVQGGPAPKVRRLLDHAGKATGAEAFPPPKSKK